jgi:hypothetical protein
MKRFHVHVAVEELSQSVRFYSTLFAREPSVLKPDYAKWMLDDPRVNFAISAHPGKSGIQHLGIQVEDASELAEIYDRLARAERPVLAEKATTCCYAQSDKQWIADPQGVAWETFLTHGDATIYGRTGAIERLDEIADEKPCCGPSPAELAAAAKPTSICGCGAKA